MVGVAALEQDVVLGARDEERSGLRQAIEALKVEIAAVHHVEGSGFGCDLIEEVYIMHLAAGDAHETRGYCRADPAACPASLPLCVRGSEPKETRPGTDRW